MTKALFINGSPRKNGNTAQLLQRAMDGAREAGAEVELVNLYDRSLNYKGCMSCFACKIKGGKKGICSFNDDLKPVLEKAMEADVLVCGSPVYCHYPSANFRAFMERLVFPAVNYSDFMYPIVNKPKHSAAIFTMNCPGDKMYQDNGYDILMDTSARQLGMFGSAAILRSYDTFQFFAGKATKVERNDYNRYDAAQIDAAHKAAVHETQFPKDLKNAFELGKHLVEQANAAGN